MDGPALYVSTDLRSRTLPAEFARLNTPPALWVRIEEEDVLCYLLTPQLHRSILAQLADITPASLPADRRGVMVRRVEVIEEWVGRQGAGWGSGGEGSAEAVSADVQTPPPPCTLQLLLALDAAVRDGDAGGVTAPSHAASSCSICRGDGGGAAADPQSNEAVAAKVEAAAAKKKGAGRGRGGRRELTEGEVESLFGGRNRE